MDVGGGLYMYDVVLKKFKFAISSPDKFLSKFTKQYAQRTWHVTSAFYLLIFITDVDRS